MKTYSDIVGDGGSKIVEQVIEQKSRIEKNLSSVRHLVAIGSGKGGVGKSTLTMQLALSIKRKGLKVSVLDADFNGPSLSKLSGTQNSLFVPGEEGFSVPKTKNGIGVVSLGALFAEPQAVHFSTVSNGESYVWRSTKEFSVLSEILACADWGSLDLLLIDLPPGVERTFQFAEFFGVKANFVLVTIPSDLSLGVVSRSVSALKDSKSHLLGYVENMNGYFCHECNKVKPLFSSTKKIEMGIPCLGSVPFDPQLEKMCDPGNPLTDIPESASSKFINEISDRLINLLKIGE